MGFCCRPGDLSPRRPHYQAVLRPVVARDYSLNAIKSPELKTFVVYSKETEQGRRKRWDFAVVLATCRRGDRTTKLCYGPLLQGLFTQCN